MVARVPRKKKKNTELPAGRASLAGCPWAAEPAGPGFAAVPAALCGKSRGCNAGFGTAYASLRPGSPGVPSGRPAPRGVTLIVIMSPK